MEIKYYCPSYLSLKNDILLIMHQIYDTDHHGSRNFQKSSIAEQWYPTILRPNIGNPINGL